jgi:hypothetical protein
MKKIYLLLALILISCSKEESECICKEAKMTLSNNGVNYFYITNLPINCNTNYPDMSQLPANYIYISCNE